VSSSKIQIPVNISDPLVLRRFLSTLVEQLDVAFGYRGSTPFVSEQSLTATQGNVTVINANLIKLNQDLVSALSNVDAIIRAEALVTLAAANTYTDTAEADANTYTDTAEAAANTYTDTAEAAANTYTDTAKTAANTYTDTAETAANTYTDNNSTNNTEQAAIADIVYTGSDTEIEAVSDKLDALLAALRSANIIAA
jgi:hypothetical protein